MRLRQNEKVELIKSVPLFQHCSKKEIADVARLADEIDLPEGKVLTREGQPGHEFFALVEGSATVVRNGRKVATMGPGSFFGEIALIKRVPRTATVTATAPVRALVIEARAFRGLIERTPSISLKVLEALAERMPPAQIG
jgi:CRP/FNR family transcriptional regulator, cyclic AMP receptor protein